jgi:hypothetical protein
MYVSIKDDKKKLTKLVKKKKIKVIFFDQLLDNLGSIDDWRAKPVRDALQPLRALARDLDIAVVGNLHPNKKADSFRQLVSGSSAFNAVSRSSLLLAAHPEDEDKRVLVRGKGNLSELPTAISFDIHSLKFVYNNKKFSVPHVRNFEKCDITVDDLIAATHNHSNAKQYMESKQRECEALIGSLFPRDGQWHASKPIIDSCEEAGHIYKEIGRAKEKLKIAYRRTQKREGTTEWMWKK